MALNYGGYKSKKQADEEQLTLTQLGSVFLLREPVPGKFGVNGPPTPLVVTLFGYRAPSFGAGAEEAFV